MVICSNNLDSPTGELYLNGVKKTLTNQTNVDEDFGKNFRIGTRYTTSSQWTGYMGPIYFYNRKLGDHEAKQNFEAQRERFGL